MNRRGFLASCLALGAAPSIVRAESLMRMVRRESGILVPAWSPVGGNLTEFKFITLYKSIYVTPFPRQSNVETRYLSQGYEYLDD